MEFNVKPTPQGVEVKAQATPEEAKKMMDEFAKCANGTCSCKTSEYEKLESMQVSETDSGLTLDLKAKSGQTLDVGCVEECLDHTAKQISP